MGITKNSSNILAYAAAHGVSFSETLMLGRQVLYVTPAEAESQLVKFKVPHKPLPENWEGQFAEPLFHTLGATLVDSMDYSSFENATILHDLGKPVPTSLKERYSVVFDGGTLEHVFNFPAAVKNCMDMLQVGGHYISISPANNQCGHGFYQFSPELFFSLFESKHGFKVIVIAVGIDPPGSTAHEWYAVEDPRRVKKIVTLSNAYPTNLLVIAEKIAKTEKVELQPMQSDYELVWEVYNSIENDIHIEKENSLLYYYRRYIPEIVKRAVRTIAQRNGGREKEVPRLGTVNPRFYRKMDL
jgi:hypothetical protein